METKETQCHPKPAVNATCLLGEKGCYKNGKCHYMGNCEHKVLTNADRIRAMSDEELAQMLNKAVVCHHLRELGYCHKCPLFGAKPCDTEGLLEWLKEPAENPKEV